MRIEGTITFASPLPTNAPLQDFSSMVTTFNFTDGLHSFTDHFVTNTFRFQTDAIGSIVAWDVYTLTQFNNGAASWRITMWNPVARDVYDSVLLIDDSVGVWAKSTAPGTWALVPEPSVLTLYGLGLLALPMTRRCTGAAA